MIHRILSPFPPPSLSVVLERFQKHEWRGREGGYEGKKKTKGKKDPNTDVAFPSQLRRQYGEMPAVNKQDGDGQLPAPRHPALSSGMTRKIEQMLTRKVRSNYPPAVSARISREHGQTE